MNRLERAEFIRLNEICPRPTFEYRDGMGTLYIETGSAGHSLPIQLAEYFWTFEDTVIVVSPSTGNSAPIDLSLKDFGLATRFFLNNRRADGDALDLRRENIGSVLDITGQLRSAKAFNPAEVRAAIKQLAL